MSQEALQEAADLIKSGKRAEARTLLVNILRENQNNAGAWWLMAYAAPNKDIAHSALEQVRRLYPDNPRVLQALETLGVTVAPSTTLADLMSNASQRILPDEPDEPFEPVDEMDTWLDIAEKRKREAYYERVKERPQLSTLRFYGGAVFVVFLAVMLIVTSLNRFNSSRGDDRADVICDTADGSETALAIVNHAADSTITIPESAIQRSELTINSRFEHIPLDTLDEQHAYTYNGTANERVRIIVWAMDTGINPTLTVYGTDGHQFAYCDDFAVDNSGLLLDVRLPETGLYTLVVYQANPTVAGDYGLTLESAD